MTDMSRSNEQAASGETPGMENGRCAFCERKGLPILPVRYAVCERNDRNSGIPELPESRIREFTDIMLDQSLEVGEEKPVANSRMVPSSVEKVVSGSSDNQVNKYILRQLRQGYLYLYDQDNPEGMYWYAYAITADGKYYQFPVLNPKPLDKIEFSCKNKPNDALNASLITLPNPDKSRILYYAFTEHAWPPEHIQMVGGDRAWRDTHMQKVDIKAWVNGDAQAFAYGTNELGWVAEYSDGADDLSEQFWSSGPQRKLFDREQLKNAMDLRLDHAASRYQGKGLILAVKDEAGIIDELNAYRHQALAATEDFFKDSDTRRRKLLCKQAIDAFQKNFARSYRESQRQALNDAVDEARQKRDDYIDRHKDVLGTSGENAPGNRDIRYQKNRLDREVREAEEARERAPQEAREAEAERERQREKLRAEIAELEAAKEREIAIQRQNIEHHRRNGNDHIVKIMEQRMQEGSSYDAHIKSKQILLDGIQSEAEEAAEEHRKQLEELYDSKDLEDFDRKYREQTAYCDALLALHDSDYAFWVRDHLSAVVGRYSRTNYWMGLGLSGLIANALRGGILSPASAGLWQHLGSQLDAEDSLVLSALFANQTSLISEARSTVSALKPAGTLTSKTLSDWGERFQAIQVKAQTLTKRPALDDEIRNRLRPVQGALAMTIGNSFASLVTYDAADVFNSDAKTWLSHFIPYAQLAYMGDPETHSGKAATPVLHRFHLSLAGYHQWLRLVMRYSESASQGADTSRALKSLDERIGNFVAPMADNGCFVDVALPAFALDAEVLERLSDSALDETYGPEERQQRWEDLQQSARDVGVTLGSAGSYGKVAALGLVLWNTLLVVDKELLSDEDTGADWAKVLGASVTLANGGMQAIEGYTKIRAASLAEDGTLARMVANGKWKLAGKVLGAVGGLVSIWDGVKKLTEAARALRLGQSASAENSMIMGGVTVGGGLATLMVIGASTGIGLAVGLLVGIVTLLVGYWTVTLVAPSVQMWIDRSLIGNHTSQVQPFDDMASEQSSLEMVF
ncbi:hypothetical protein KGQ96_01935, partial [Halomonas coralii]|uniref:T6SS effector BTH_I2691 family protein n=1 Tax=Modicisalibacter sp. R2A 31.J TaxID=2831898 RepID=UPI001E15B1F2|nr:hypothetical protein [Modicisalibacter sp. R2A 31.J]